jgi:flagella basal body P-ring formation protein FlgA
MFHSTRLVIFAALLTASPGLADTLRVSLRPATTAGATVTLGDVARLTGDTAQSVETLPIMVGDDNEVEADDVLAALSDAGIRSHQILLRGPDVCIVRRSQPAQADAANDEWAAVTPAQPTVQAVESTVTVDQPVAAARPFVAKLVRPVARGVIVREDDVARIHDTGRFGRSLATFDVVVGQTARRNLRIGEFLKSRDLEAPLLVKRGQQVKLSLDTGGIAVTLLATSQDDAGFGQVIRCRVDTTGEILRAVTTAPGAARVTH